MLPRKFTSMPGDSTFLLLLVFGFRALISYTKTSLSAGAFKVIGLVLPTQKTLTNEKTGSKKALAYR